MSFGFNSNVRVGDVVYHVQTEQRGLSEAVLDTVVYVSGRVVHRLQTKLRAADARDDSSQALGERVERQHLDVISQIEHGAIRADATGSADAAASSVAARRAAKSTGLTIRPIDRAAWFKQAVGAAPGETAVAEIKVEVIRVDGTAAAGAEVEARVESGGVLLATVLVSADAEGKATLELPVRAGVTEIVAFVVIAKSGELRGELRFRLRARAVATPQSRSEE